VTSDDPQEQLPPGLRIRSGDPLSVVSLSGRILFWNEAAEEQLKIPARHAVGAFLADISRTPETRDVNWGHHITTVGAHLSDNPPVRRVLRTRDNANQPILVRVSSVMLHLDDRLPVILYSHTVERADVADEVELLPPLGLTEREWEVACLLMSGLGTSEIAYELKIAYATVRAHIRNLLATLGAHTRTQALMRLWSRYGTPEVAEFPGVHLPSRSAAAR
jgi:DNA-binding CsgD family transcriptional regulator